MNSIDKFLDYLQNEKGKADNTILAYRKDLTGYQEFLQKKGISRIEDAGSSDAALYLMEMKNEGKSKATVNRRLASIRAYYKFLVKKGVIKENPAEDIRTPKIAVKEIQYLSVEEVEKLLSLPDDSTKGLRDRAMLEVLYATGIRVSEIVELRLSDVDLSLGFVKCAGGHGRPRIVPMGIPARNALREYLRKSRPFYMKEQDASDPDGMLFVNFSGEAFTRQGFWRILKQYGEESGLGDRLNPQTLRNSFAMHMVANGIDVLSLQEMMGHEDITATKVYFGNTKNKIKNVYDKTHPRAR